MKTFTTKRIDMLKLTRTLAVAVLMGTGLTASAQCSASYTYTVNSSNNGEVNFSGSYTGGATTYFTWDFGNGGSSSGALTATCIYLTGTYTACLYTLDSSLSCSDTVCQTFSVVNSTSPAIACDASFSIVQDSLDNYMYYVYTNAVSPSPTADYYWNFGDGTIIAGQYPTHTYAGTGPYYLCLQVLDTVPGTSGLVTCSDMYCDSVAAGRSSTGITVNVVAPLATGISEHNTTTLLENYPNPFSGSTTINYAIAADAAVELNVVDLLGNKVAALESGHKSAGSYSVVWNAESTAQGMYLLQMKTNNTITIKKIIISK